MPSGRTGCVAAEEPPSPPATVRPRAEAAPPFPRAGGSGGLLDALLRRGSRDARTAGEFEEPVWQKVERTDFARVLGSEPDLDYPPGTYTVAVVTALAAGQRPAVIDFDPRQLRTQLHHLASLHDYRQALLAGSGDRPGLPALPLLAADGHAGSARAAEALGIAIRVLVPDALGAVEDYQRLSISSPTTRPSSRSSTRPA